MLRRVYGVTVCKYRFVLDAYIDNLKYKSVRFAPKKGNLLFHLFCLKDCPSAAVLGHITKTPYLARMVDYNVGPTTQLCVYH